MFIKAALDHDAAAWELIPVTGPVQHSDASVPVAVDVVHQDESRFDGPREVTDFAIDTNEVQSHLGCPSADVVTVLLGRGVPTYEGSGPGESASIRWVWWREDGGVRRLLLTAHEVYLLSDSGDTIERIRD